MLLQNQLTLIHSRYPCCSSHLPPDLSIPLLQVHNSYLPEYTLPCPLGRSSCVRMRSLFAPREEESSSDYLWLDADHLLSWLWWFSKSEAFSPRFLQNMENCDLGDVCGECDVPNSRKCWHWTCCFFGWDLCSGQCIYCRVLLQGQHTKGLTQPLLCFLWAPSPVESGCLASPRSSPEVLRYCREVQTPSFLMWKVDFCGG